MNTSQTILELQALEAYFEEGRRRCFALRKGLEGLVASAPSQEQKPAPEDNAKLIAILNKRKSRFTKTVQAGRTKT